VAELFEPLPSQSDLYTWREIFRLYQEAEIFEDVSEGHHSERSQEDSEDRLQLFAARVAQGVLGDWTKFQNARTQEALKRFMRLITTLLNIKKFQTASNEAVDRILKKRAIRTSLPQASDLVPCMLPSLSRIIAQSIGETLLPIVPCLDDYLCLICMDIAFKPIRLNCGHLFCVRCLVKMQKRGKEKCPMCRAPNVLIADQSNVDWALMNFMRDWFPIESKEKLESNEKEANVERLMELGLDLRIAKTWFGFLR